MLCEAKCDAGGPNQLADHHWKSGTLDSPWLPDNRHQKKQFFSVLFDICYDV